MSFGTKMSNSWKLTRACFNVLWNNPKLMVYPSVTFFVSIWIIVGFIGYSYGVDAWIKHTGGPQWKLLLMILMGSLVIYFIMAFIAILSNAAIVGALGMLLQGEKPTVGDGYTIAISRIGSLVMWSVMTSLVTVVASFGRLMLSAVGIAWSVLTYFVVPVMIFEGVGPFKGVKRSKDILRAHWGESLITNFGIWTALSVIYLALLIFLTICSFLLITMDAVPLALYLIALMLLMTVTFGLVAYTLKGILMTSLYWYSITGDPGFDIPTDPLNDLFRKR